MVDLVEVDRKTGEVATLRKTAFPTHGKKKMRKSSGVKDLAQITREVRTNRTQVQKGGPQRPKKTQKKRGSGSGSTENGTTTLANSHDHEKEKKRNPENQHRHAKRTISREVADTVKAKLSYDNTNSGLPPGGKGKKLHEASGTQGTRGKTTPERS